MPGDVGDQNAPAAEQGGVFPVDAGQGEEVVVVASHPGARLVARRHPQLGDLRQGDRQQRPLDVRHRLHFLVDVAQHVADEMVAVFGNFQRFAVRLGHFAEVTARDKRLHRPQHRRDAKGDERDPQPRPERVADAGLAEGIFRVDHLADVAANFVEQFFLTKDPLERRRAAAALFDLRERDHREVQPVSDPFPQRFGPGALLRIVVDGVVQVRQRGDDLLVRLVERREETVLARQVIPPRGGLHVEQQLLDRTAPA